MHTMQLSVAPSLSTPAHSESAARSPLAANPAGSKDSFELKDVVFITQWTSSGLICVLSGWVQK